MVFLDFNYKYLVITHWIYGSLWKRSHREKSIQELHEVICYGSLCSFVVHCDFVLGSNLCWVKQNWMPSCDIFCLFSWVPPSGLCRLTLVPRTLQTGRFTGQNLPCCVQGKLELLSRTLQETKSVTHRIPLLDFPKIYPKTEVCYCGMKSCGAKESGCTWCLTQVPAKLLTTKAGPGFSVSLSHPMDASRAHGGEDGSRSVPGWNWIKLNNLILTTGR